MIGFYRRYIEIAVRLLPFAVTFLRDRRRFILFGNRRRVSNRIHRERAQRLTETLLTLGPAFIKAGQVLSTRPDLVPPVYAESLGTLQDQVPESEDVDPVVVIEDSLSDDVLDLNTLEPIAGGSLAYVYTAETTSGGERVAVKVRRPGVKQHIERDLRIIRGLVRIIRYGAPERLHYSLRNIADDFEEIILDELDFEREARMMERIRDNLSDDERIRIPWADTKRSTERVLVMEFVEGVKITDEAVFDGREVDSSTMASVIIEVYLRMGLVHGVFHADPHPGNLAIDANDRLVIYDFGMSEELLPSVQKQIIEFYLSLSKRDIDGLIDALIGLDILEPTVDRREVRQVLDMAIESLAGQPEVTWRDIFSEVTFSLKDFPFRIPPDVMLLLRVGTVGEGVCRSLDPEFDFLEAVRAHLRKEGHLKRRVQQEIRELNRDLIRSIPIMVGLPRRIDLLLNRIERNDFVIQSGEEQIRRSDSALGYAILAAGLFVTAGLTFPYSNLVGAIAIGFGLLFLVGFLSIRIFN